jgi:hypothetical protein
MRASSGIKQNDLFYCQKEMEMLGNSNENKWMVCIRQKGPAYDMTKILLWICLIPQLLQTFTTLVAKHFKFVLPLRRHRTSFQSRRTTDKLTALYRAISQTIGNRGPLHTPEVPKMWGAPPGWSAVGPLGRRRELLEWGSYLFWMKYASKIKYNFW